jgi:hypothetical protein
VLTLRRQGKTIRDLTIRDLTIHGLIMRDLWRGLTALAASAALVLHLLLTALGPGTASAGYDPVSFDPYAITCLSGGHGAAGGAPEQPASLPGHQCDLCVMCAAVALPAPEATSFGAALVHATTVIAPRVEPPHIVAFERPRPPRGPPQTA